MNVFDRVLALFSLFLALYVVSGCASARETVNPMVGAWDYSVDADGQLYNGELRLMSGEEGFSGAIVGDGMGDPIDIENVTHEESMLQFEFQTPEYGTFRVRVEVSGDSFSGDITMVSQGLEFPITGTRQGDL